jgi:hypothetical protein
MTIEEEAKDILDCISVFDPDETLKNKGRYFDVIQNDVKKLLKRIKETK